MQHTTPPGMTQGRRVALLRLRDELVSMGEWYAMHGACEATIARIDALLATTHPPHVAETAQERLAQLIPRIVSVLSTSLPLSGELQRSLVDCLRQSEKALGVPHTFPDARERRQQWQSMRRVHETVEG